MSFPAKTYPKYILIFLLLVIGILYLLTLSADQLHAVSTGRTGKNGSPSSNGTCNDCHNDGTAPIVTITGETTVLTNSTAVFELVVSGVQDTPFSSPGAGFNVGLDPNGGMFLESADLDPYVKLLNGEITHTSKKPANLDEAETRFTFRWQAPNTSGQYTLYGIGNSVDGNFSPSGDRAALTTLVINVVEPTHFVHLPVVVR